MTESERKKDQHTQQISESVDRIKEKYPEFEARKDRFRFVCSDMLERLQNSTGQDFELFSVRIEEAGRLALSFGFQNPPIRSLFYERDGVSTISPPGPTNTPTQPLYWNNLRLNHPEVMFATGYRIYDPCIIPGNDFMASTFENGHFPVNDEWIDHVRS